MKIEFDASVMNDEDAYVWLDRILHKVTDGWHTWDTTSLLDFPNWSEYTWISQSRVREMFIASTKRLAWMERSHGRTIRVTATPSAPSELGPEEATRLAEEPMYILVENRISDGAFVKRIVVEFDKALHQVFKRPGEPIRFDSVGGIGQIKAEVQARVERTPWRPRLVVIVDSDRNGPDEQASSDARSLSRYCQEQEVPCWILNKRGAENYIPRTLLDELGNQRGVGDIHKTRVDAWSRLTDVQKDYFDMKDGLSERPGSVEAALFCNLSEQDRAILSIGFGKNVFRSWCLWTVRAAVDLLRRGGDDLERGLNLIRQEV